MLCHAVYEIAELVSVEHEQQCPQASFINTSICLNKSFLGYYAIYISSIYRLWSNTLTCY